MIVRIGRVLHWASFAIAGAGFVLIVIALSFVDVGDGTNAIEFSLWLIGIAIGGRALRYILANE